MNEDLSLAKHRFTKTESYAVWAAFDGLCYWCRKPLAISEVTIDHVLPEDLESDPDRLTAVITEYGLPIEYDLNSFENWVPCHHKCNAEKGSHVFDATPAMMKVLHDVSKRSERARNVHDATKTDKKKGTLLGKLEAAIENGTLTRDDIAALTDVIENVPPALTPIPGWTVIREESRLVYMTNGNRVGVTSLDSDRHHSWDCPTCGQPGPWNGAICLSCGHMSDGD